LRKLFDDVDALRRFREPSGCEHSRTCSTSMGVDAGAQCDHGGDLSPHTGSGRPTTAAVEMRRVAGARLSTSAGPMFSPAADDGVVGATFAEQVAVDVDPAAVAAVKPAVGVDLRIGADVVAADLLASDEDFAGFIGCHLVAFDVDDADLDAGTGRPTDASGLERGSIAVEREAVIVGAEERDGACSSTVSRRRSRSRFRA